MRFAYPLSILLGLVLALSGCGDDGSTPDPDMTVVEDDGGPSCDAPPEALMEATGTGVADVLAVPSGESRAGLVAAGDLPEDPTDLLVWSEGDFLLANENVAVVIEALGPSDGYDPWGGNVVGMGRVEGGALVEPAGFNEIIRGMGRYTVEPRSIGVLADGSDGGAAIVRVLGTPRPIPFADELAATFFPTDYSSLDVAVDYVLEPGADHVDIRYTFRNDGARRVAGRWVVLAFQKERMPAFAESVGFDTETATGLDWLGYADPAATSYGFGTDLGTFGVFIEVSGTQILDGPSYDIDACANTTVEMMTLDIGGPGANGLLAAKHRREGVAQRTITGTVTEADGSPAVGVRVHATQGDTWLTRALAGEDGGYTLDVPGDDAVTLTAWRPGDAMVTAEVAAGGATADLALDEPGMLRITAVDGSDAPVPVRIQVRPEGGAVAPPASWGEKLPFGGRLHLEFPVDGRADLRVPPGNHRVTVSRGFDYELGFDETVAVAAGDDIAVDAVLQRVVDEPGVICADYHIHTHRSPDSPDSPEMKLRSAAGDGLEIACRSDHEWVYAWEDLIAQEGLESWLYGPTSLELTTFTFGHFGVVDLEPQPSEPNNGAIPWVGDLPPVVFDRVRARPEDPLFIINHPRGTKISGYFDYVGYDAVTGMVEDMDAWDDEFRVVEVFNDSSFDENLDGTVADWFSFLRTGRHMVAVGSSDSHKVVNGSPVGYPRTCLRLGVDDPEALRAGAGTEAVVDATRAGHLVVDGGISLDARVGDAGPGDEVTGTGTQSIAVRVMAPSWVDATELEVWIDGALTETLPLGPGDGVERFAGDVEVDIPATGGWVLLHARGEMALDPVFPGRDPFGVTMPIFFVP